MLASDPARTLNQITPDSGNPNSVKTRPALKAFDAGAKKLEFVIDVCLWATGKVSSSWSPYEWLIVSYVEGRAFRMRAGRPMMISPREVLRPR